MEVKCLLAECAMIWELVGCSSLEESSSFAPRQSYSTSTLECFRICKTGFVETKAGGGERACTFHRICMTNKQAWTKGCHNLAFWYRHNISWTFCWRSPIDLGSEPNIWSNNGACMGRLARDTVKPSFGLTDNDTFKHLKKLIKEQKVRWLHSALPCKTFSRARRQRLESLDRLNYQKVSSPSHCQPPIVKEANKPASRRAQLWFYLQWKPDWWFSVEIPQSSLVWIFKLLKLLDVEVIADDHCCYGGEYKKPSGWMTNMTHSHVLRRACIHNRKGRNLSRG